MNRRQRIAVAGATGRVGRHVADVLETEGHEVVAISRSDGVDLITGDGLADALVGATTIVDAATGPSPDQKSATEFLRPLPATCRKSGERAGVQRIVVVSIIGTESFRAGYGAATLVHERAMLSGPVPATILRAAQFHEFVPELVDWGRQNGVSYVAEMRTQLVAARTVAEVLADLAAAPASQEPRSNGERIPEIAGPREESLVEMAKLLVSRRGDPVRIKGANAADLYGVDMAELGALLPGPDATLAGPTFEDWLGEET
jgi:uncharacterized protein YbjT (DUF2867 family)